MWKRAFVVLCVGIARAQNGSDDSGSALNDKNNVTCPDYRGWDGNISDVLGSWTARELYMHLDDEGVQVYDTCVRINMTETTDRVRRPKQQVDKHAELPQTSQTMVTPSPYYHQTFIQSTYFRENRRLRLVWDENGNDVEYTLYFRNSSVGYWDSHGDQIGSLATGKYRQFTGTVQVLKAVRDHLLLHFCQAPRDGNPAQLFSILLSREPRTLNRWDINAAHDLLRRKGLSVSTRRLVCGNSGGHQVAASMLTVAAAALVFVSRAAY